MIVVYVPQASPRNVYVFKQVFEHFLKVNYTLVTQPPVLSDQTFLINYSAEYFPCDLHILPAGLLAENTVRQDLQPTVNVKGNTVQLFLNGSDHFGFDIFSAIFWMLSRYEEYQTFAPDHHQRFPATASLAHRQGFILLPVVDQWVKALKDMINKKIHGFIPAGKFTMINTIDVDNAFAYKGKGFVRQTGALLKHLFKGQLGEWRERIKVLRGKSVDPYDNYAYIQQVAEAHGVKTIFFHLAGSVAAHDRNIDPQHPVYTALIGQLKTWSVQGIHPSYQSNTREALVLVEKQKIEQAAGCGVEHSRQHFLRLQFPQTYRNLLQAGIKYDFSMGFADHTGFRAGTGRVFTFFDLEANAETPLLVQPLCIMEGTLKDYMHLSPEEAIRQIVQVRDLLKTLDSTYVAIWHNETLGEHKSWKGWRKVYESQFA